MRVALFHTTASTAAVVAVLGDVAVIVVAVDAGCSSDIGDGSSSKLGVVMLVMILASIYLCIRMCSNR